MANYTSAYTGQDIDKNIGEIQNNTFSNIMNGVTPNANSNGKNIPTTEWVTTKLNDVTKYQNPIGWIFEWSGQGLTNAPDLSTPEKVASYFGYGTWELFGKGRVLVGLDSSQTLFNTDGKTGGNNNAIVVSHNHSVPRHRHIMGDVYSSGSLTTQTYYKRENTSSSTARLTGYNYNNEGTQTNTVGTDGKNKNLQPYIVVYRYRRVA